MWHKLAIFLLKNNIFSPQMAEPVTRNMLREYGP